MSAPIISEDGYWEYDGTEWIPTVKQKFALQNGLIPHNSQNVVSEDGFWELINGEWQPTSKQKIAINNGIKPHGQNLSVSTHQYQTYYHANISSNNAKALICVGIGFVIAILISIIVIVASISSEIAIDTSADVIELGDDKGKNFIWEYDGKEYSMQVDLNEGTYNFYKSKNQNCCYEDEDYLRYYDTDSTYIQDVAQVLESSAIAEGYTTPLKKAEFILAFVGSIPYVLDPDDDFDHPKYPIETLWENSGDCEDSSALYGSIMEYLGYRTILVLLDAKADSGDSWGGHAMIGIHIPNHSGDYFSLQGDTRQYYQAETTEWIDGYGGIGVDWWYDMQNINTYEIE